MDNKHLGSNFGRFLIEEGIEDDVSKAAMKYYVVQLKKANTTLKDVDHLLSEGELLEAKRKIADYFFEGII